jgi:hypothetical protein
MIMRKVMYGLTSVMAVVVLIGFLIGVAEAGPCELAEFQLTNFSDPGDNIYFPLVPGTTFVYEAETEDELILNEITVTSETELILGVSCTVVEDVEWISVDDGGTWILIEDTDDWYANDNAGNVWYFGEDTLKYLYDEDWILTGTSTEGSWKAGDFGALPGIIILADPTPGACVQQEYYEDEAEDRGKVLKLNASVSIELGDYEDCLETKEWTPLEPGNVEHKYYAPGVGLVFIEELKEKTVEVELVDILP